MTRVPDSNSCLLPTVRQAPDRLPAPQAPDAVELSPDAQSQAVLLSQQHKAFGFISSWIAQHAGPCAISHSSNPPHNPLQNHRSVSHPPSATGAEGLAQPHAQALHSRLLGGPSADADGFSHALQHQLYPPPSICSANSAQGEPSSQCSVNSIHSYPSHHPPKSKQQNSHFRHRGAQSHHTHSPAGGAGPGHAANFGYKSHQANKQATRQNQRRSYSGSPFPASAVNHASAKSNSTSWRSSGHVQPPHGPPPAHVRPLSSYEARHLSSPPCLPQQPAPPALPEAYAVPHRNLDRHRSIHYSHPVHHSYLATDHIPGPPPLPEATAVSAWGHRPPPPPARHTPQRPAPPPPPPTASAGKRSMSQPSSQHASPHPDPLAMQQREAPPPPPLPQTPPHERPHSDLDRFLQAVDRLWAAPPPPPAPADCARALQRDQSCSQDHLESGAARQARRQASEPASPSDRGGIHRPCNPIDNSNGSEGNDTLDSALPDAGSGVVPAPATLADVWSRVQECSAFGLEVPCSAHGTFSCSYFVPHLSALHIVATVPPDEQGGLDTLFYEGASPLPPEVLRGGRMHEYAVDEAATDGTAEDSGTDPHAISGDGDTVPSPGGGGMFMDSSGFLHSGAPSTSRGSVMHDACCHTDTNTERCLSRPDLSDLPPVFSSRVDDAIVNTSPRALSLPATKASLRLVANWAAEGPSWERPPMYLHVQELCGAAGNSGQARPGGVSGNASPVPTSAAGVLGRSASTSTARSAGIPCPAALSSTPLRNIHPSSWFAILWHPLCRIPDSDLRARFITYHEVGCAGIEPLHQHSSGGTAAAAAACGGGGGSGGLSGASAMGAPPLGTGIQGAPRIVGALVDIGEDGGNWMVPTLVGPDGCVHRWAAGDDRQKLVAMLRGAADALSKSTLFIEMADGPQALPFVHHDHKFVCNLQET